MLNILLKYIAKRLSQLLFPSSELYFEDDFGDESEQYKVTLAESLFNPSLRPEL